MADKDRYGTKIDRWLVGHCPECGSSADLAPGPLNDDESIEYRKCTEGHVVESEPIFWAPTGESTENGIH